MIDLSARVISHPVHRDFIFAVMDRYNIPFSIDTMIKWGLAECISAGKSKTYWLLRHDWLQVSLALDSRRRMGENVYDGPQDG